MLLVDPRGARNLSMGWREPLLRAAAIGSRLRVSNWIRNWIPGTGFSALVVALVGAGAEFDVDGSSDVAFGVDRPQRHHQGRDQPNVQHDRLQA